MMLALLLLVFPDAGGVKVSREVVPGVGEHLPDVLHDVLAAPQLGEVAARVVVETLKQHLGSLHYDKIVCISQS